MPRAIRIPLLAAGALASSATIAALLFLAAGRWDVPIWWAYVAIAAALSLIAMLAVDPGLIRERLRPGPGGQDRYVLYVGKLLLVTHLLMAGSDVGRFHRSDDVPTWARIGGLVLFGAGFGLAVWAMVVNRFFSPVVRLQSERGHMLITSGPYALVRHPGYIGISVALLASGVALGSWLSVLPMMLMVAIIVRRTALEDRFLQSRLDGYHEYAKRVRYRLVPGPW
jgi:protein-S-isoprenylcysteine O-methyltransferase Ste14